MCGCCLVNCYLFIFKRLYLFRDICSRQSGHRFGEHIERFVPLIHDWSRADDDETREFCLQAFESFINRCPKEITPKINGVKPK